MRAIVLPWPPRELHPNARPHHMQKAAAAKAYRTQAHWIAKAAQASVPAEGEIVLAVTFNPPDRRRRDLDGMFSASKAGLDGIADALAADDYRFAFTIRRAEPCKGGKVVVEIGGTECDRLDMPLRNAAENQGRTRLSTGCGVDDLSGRGA